MDEYSSPIYILIHKILIESIYLIIKDNYNLK